VVDIIRSEIDDPRLGFNGSLQGLLMRKLAVNSKGEIAVVNSRYNPGEASRVRLFRGRLGGRTAEPQPPRP
jgi:hypothetical protein